jgi:hypothetical protein
MGGAILQESVNTSNHITDNNKNIEHKRELLLEILRQREVFIDSETGKIIDDKTDIQTLLNVIQKQKEKVKEKVRKKKGVHETSCKTDNSVPKKVQPYISSVYNPWYPRYRSASELIYELIIAWLFFLSMNPVTGWFYYPIVFGWTQ